MGNPEDCKYTKEHEWVKVESGVAQTGITEFAQSELGELVYIELPEVGQTVSQGESYCVVESTKAASDVYAPISGKVAEVNPALSDNPALINSAPFTDGWIVKLEECNEDELGGLMSAEEYQSFLGEQ